MGSTGRTWAQDTVWDAAFVIIALMLLSRSSTDDFTVCDGASKFGTAKSSPELQAQVSSGHRWGSQCASESSLIEAGLTRKLSSKCLSQASSSYSELAVALAVSSIATVSAASINDLILWRSTDGSSGVKKFRAYVTTPTMIIGSVAAFIVSILLINISSDGWTCETDDAGAWLFITVATKLSLTNMVLVLTFLLFRMASILINALYAIVDGQPRFMIHRPVLTTTQVRGAYSDGGEHEPLLSAEKTTGRVQAAVRPWVTAFYRRHNPTKMQAVEDILANYVGSEEHLYKELHTKYEITEEMPGDAHGDAVIEPADVDSAKEELLTLTQKPTSGSGNHV